MIAGVVETEAERRLLAKAIGMPVAICRLAAATDVLEQRIRGRGRDHGADLAKLAAPV